MMDSSVHDKSNYNNRKGIDEMDLSDTEYNGKKARARE